MLEFTYNHPNRKNARRTLRQNITPQEKMLWSYVRNNSLGVKFKRQYSVSGYIIDFYCPEKRLGVELDGLQHMGNKEYDDARTKLLNDFDIKIIRFWNSEVDKNIKEVLEKIKRYINEFFPSPM